MNPSDPRLPGLRTTRLNKLTHNAVKNAVGMRMFAVVACAQNVVETPRSEAANRPATIDPVSVRTVRLMMTSVIAARMALSRFNAKAGRNEEPREQPANQRVQRDSPVDRNAKLPRH